jgi:outer membrane autotransporter protein
VTPQVVVSNFGTAGRYGFDQKTSGTEVGIDFAINDQFRVGALMAKTDARQSLSTGVGSMRLDGDTAGVFATWHPVEGAYVDASYRRMRFDTRMDTDAGRFTSDGEAGTFNLEAGWGWLLGNGLLLEPQLQYTRTELDGMNTVRGGVSDFHADDGTSSTGRLGLLASKRFGTGTTWTPYASLNAVREYDGEYGYGVNNVFFGATSTEGTSTLAETGIEVRFKYNVSITGSLHWQDGGAWDGFFGGQMGVRFTW